MPNDPFATKRQQMRDEFFAKLFLLGGWLGGTDTYKRTMWSAVPEIALQHAAYTLTFRKGLPEVGTANRLVMAGHEAMLSQWFHRPLKRSDVALAQEWYAKHSATKAFPAEVWAEVLAQSGDDLTLPVDVWGFPGGQTFLACVPCLAFEGPGGLISYLEPAMCRYFAPVIQATKARLMREATPRDAEFGLRSAPVEVCNLILLLARFVGGAGGEGSAQLTSNDTAEFLWPELFRSIGTIGHEMMCAAQSFEKTLAAAEFEMMDRFVSKMGTASLLCDLVDAETVGLENALRVIKTHPETDRVGVRVDSGDIAAQCVLYFQKMKELGIPPRVIVFEDEVTPDGVRRVYDVFRQQTGLEPTMLFPGAGGYWWKLVHRDTVSAAFKRTATEDRPNVKFSNSPGKETIPGYLRVYGRGDTLVVADRSEHIDGEPLFVKLVAQGRVVYSEDFCTQAARAEATWGRYTRWETSPLVAEHMHRFQAMRTNEIAAARAAFGEFRVITFQPHTRSVTALAFTPDGGSLASVSHDQHVKVWEVTGLACQTLRWEVKDNTAINHCQFSPDGTELYTGGSDGCIRVWATADGKPLREYKAKHGRVPSTAVFAFALSRDGRRIVWCGRTMGGGTFHVIVGRTKKLNILHRIPAHQHDGMILATYPGGFCSGSADRTVKFWDWDSKTCHHTIRLRGVSRALAISSDYKRLAIAGVTTIAIQQLSGHSVTGTPVNLRGHRRCIECVEFSPDGTKLASVSQDGTLRIWDAITGECVRIFALGLKGLHWATYAPDGLTLAYSSLKGDIGLLDLDG